MDHQWCSPVGETSCPSKVFKLRSFKVGFCFFLFRQSQLVTVPCFFRGFDETSRPPLYAPYFWDAFLLCLTCVCFDLSALQRLCEWKVLHPSPSFTWRTDHNTAGSCNLCGHLWRYSGGHTPYYYIQSYFCWMSCEGMSSHMYNWSTSSLVIQLKS